MPVMADRWSPRSFDANHKISQHQLLSILEAGRWAPSANNGQPWRFSIFTREAHQHDAVIATFSGFNQAWGKNGSAVIIISVPTHLPDGRDYSIAKFDAGLAAQNMMLQAQDLGLHAHPMSGFDHPALNQLLELPDGLESLVAIVVGELASPDLLDEGAREREVAPRVRKDLDDLILHGKP